MPAAASVKLGSKRTCGVAASLTLALHRPSSLPAQSGTLSSQQRTAASSLRDVRPLFLISAQNCELLRQLDFASDAMRHLPTVARR